MNDLVFDNCNLCLDNFTDTNKPMVIKCGHTICSNCLKKVESKCPYCKKTFGRNSAVINYHIVSSIDEINNNQITNEDILKTQPKFLDLKKIANFNFMCYKHPDIDVINYCSTCEQFTCIECSYACSQFNHIVKYINKKYFNIYNKLVYEFKNIYANSLIKKIKNNDKVNNFLDMLDSNVSDQSSYYSKLLKSYDNYNDLIDKQVSKLKSFKTSINTIKSSIISKINKFKTDCSNILNIELCPLLMDCYINKNSTEHFLLDNIYKSCFVYEDRVKLLSKIEDEYISNIGFKELKEFKDSTDKIVNLYNKFFVDSFNDIHKTINSSNNSAFINELNKTFKNLDEVLTTGQIMLSNHIDEIEEKNIFSKNILDLNSLYSSFNKSIKKLSSEIINF